MPSAIQVINMPPGDSLDSGDPQEMLVVDVFLVTAHGACNRDVLKKVRRSVNDDVSWYRYERHRLGMTKRQSYRRKSSHDRT